MKILTMADTDANSHFEFWFSENTFSLLTPHERGQPYLLCH